MLKKKALRKIFITTMSLFVIMTIYMIPYTDMKEKTMEANLELEYVTGLGNHSLYLLNKDQFLVKTKILLDSSDPLENVATILTNLTISSSSKFPESLEAIIPKNTKVLQTSLKDKTLTLNFSKEFLTVSEDLEEKMIEAIVYSVTELKEITGVKLEVEAKPLTTYPVSGKKLDERLTRKIGINKRYNFTSTKDISKVVVYYLQTIEDDSYYVPVTKYVNDSRDKIEIIVEELTTGYIYEPSLMSLVNENTKLMDARIEDELFILNFNDALFDSKGTIKEEVLYTLSYSIFDNYDVFVASFRVDDQEIAQVKKSDLP